ncbi:alpha/beta hydrolase [Longispora fulva]|uniref:alpha/beta hydrolase n=1 Tax=Longispora fulva TaxID=619741 RepID=UPI0018CA10B7|nr:alpha/beta hydrolase [Longispora fulva]
MRTQRMRNSTPQLYTLSLEEAREADLASIRASGGIGEPVHRVIDMTIPGPGGELPIRIYQPEGPGPFPTLTYFFGGGWTLGSIDTSDGICRSLANAADCMVVTIGYRLAPETKFPGAIEDCYAALRWIDAHAKEIDADPARLAVGGDSAGGNLAAAVTLLTRERGGPALVGQLLVYPNTDYFSDTPSLRENTDPWLFNQTSVSWYWNHYLTDPEQGRDPLASPLRAADHSGLPPALVITAEYDPIRDQGEQYAERLRHAGVATELTRYDGMVHGFFAMASTLDGGKRAMAQAAAQLRTWFAPA